MYVQIVQMRVKGVLDMIVVYNLYGSVRWSGLSLCHFFSCPSFISEKRSGRWRQISPLKVDDTNVMLSHQPFFQIWSRIGEVMVQGHHIPMLMTPPPRRDPAQNISRRCLSPYDLTPYKNVIPHQGKVGNMRRVRNIFILAYNTRSRWKTMSKSQKKTFVKSKVLLLKVLKAMTNKLFMRATVMFHIWNTSGHGHGLKFGVMKCFMMINHKCKWS